MLFKKVFIFLFLILSFIIFSQDAFAVCNRAVSPYCTFGAVVLTGGGTGALDKINGNDIAAGDIAITVTSTNRYFHTAKTSGCGAESPPDTIIPDTNPGTKCWVRVHDESLKIGAGTPLIATGTGDLYVTDALEVSGATSYFAGNVGIGTTSPAAALLDVNGAANIRGQLDLYDNAMVRATYIQGSTNLTFYPVTGAITPAFYFYSGNAASVWTERLRITGAADIANVIFSNSNVGIGTTTPGTKLDVAGDITVLAGSDIRPSANSTTALNIAQADGTNFVTFDTINKKVSIGTSITGTSVFNIKGNVDSALTGTVSVDADSNAVTGVGTTFTSQLMVGDAIKIADEIFTISAIASNTALTLDSNHVAGASGVTAYRDSRNFVSVLTGDGANQFSISRAGLVTIGVTSTTPRLIYGKKTFNTTSPVYGSFLDVTNSLSGSVTGQYVKGVSTNPSGTINELIGGFYQIEQQGAGTINTLSGFRAITTVGSSGPVTNSIVLDIRGGAGGVGQTTNAKGISILDFSGSVGAATNASGIWIEKQTKGSTLNAGIVLNGDGVGSDLVLGSAQDHKIFYEGTNNETTINDAIGEVLGVGRGTTDMDITYIALRNAAGTKTYIYPDAAGTGITVSTTRP